MENTIICGNSLNLLPTIVASSVNLVLTSPPYAQQRATLYNSISEVDYPTWTVNWMELCKPLLQETGSIAIIIRPHIQGGKLSDYVLKTRLAVREAGWTECDELLWVKPNSPPLGHTKRPRRSWESILWFSLNPRCYCDPLANGHPSGRIGFVGKKGKGKYVNGMSPDDWNGKQGIARCRDYIEVGTSECDHSKTNTHPAQFPVRLGEWIIKLLSPTNGLVLDPFVGSGTTALAALNTNRRYIGLDCSEEYCSIARQRLGILGTETVDQSLNLVLMNQS